MEQDRATVEITIQIGAETDTEAMAILMTEGRKVAKRLIEMPEQAERVDESQWCAGAMRVTVRRPGMAQKAGG